MSEHITLYRGDYTEIEEFRYRKTDRFCLLGKGIYLTDDIKLAETYRSKGASSIKRISNPIYNISQTLHEGYFNNRLEAYEKAFSYFCVDQYLLEFGRYPTLSKESEKKIYKRYCESKRNLYFQMIDSGEIYSIYLNNISTNGKKSIAVKYKSKPVVRDEDQLGYITEFSFNKSFLFNNIIDADTIYSSPDLWKLLYRADIKIGHKPPCDDEIIYSAYNANRISLLAAVDKTVTEQKAGFYSSERASIFKRIEETLSPYGIIGYKYNGGTRSGGKRHSAFCIWDEEFVNKHKVNTYK